MTVTAIAHTTTRLPREGIPDASALLASAFAGDPLMRFLFGDRGMMYQYGLHMFFTYILRQRLRQGALPLSRLSGAQVVGIASIAEPFGNHAEPAAWEPPAFMGPRTAARFELYNQAVDTHAPAQPHVYLGVLGVHPRAQARGHGRALLEAVRVRSAANPDSAGVYLDTTQPDNVALYQRFGYQVVGFERLDGIQIWCMFRPND
jgi:ribosomal protein S18 acetylase RimI-like enzyme